MKKTFSPSNLIILSLLLSGLVIIFLSLIPPQWIEIEPGTGSNALNWIPTATPQRIPPGQDITTLLPATDHLKIRIPGMLADDIAIFSPLKNDKHTRVRLCGSSRISLAEDGRHIQLSPPHVLTLPLAIIGMLQVLFLPGIILLRAFCARLHWLSTLILSFALSLLCNSFLVMIAWSLHVYTQLFMSCCIVLEMLWLHHIFRQKGPLILPSQTSLASRITAIRDHIWQLSLAQRLFWYLSIITAIIGLGWISGTTLSTFGKIITHWDAVHSWNRWAINFASGNMVSGGLYPQLLPKNLSLPYVLAGSTYIEFFTRALMPFFPLGIILGMVDLGRATRNPGYFLGAGVTALLLYAYCGDLVTAAYADVPVAFMGFTGVYALLLGSTSNDQNKAKMAFLAAILFAGAAHTKQAGLFYVVVFPLLTSHLLLHNIKKPNQEYHRKILQHSSILCILLTIPAYLLNIVLLLLGKMQHNLILLTQTIHGGRTIWERILFSISSMHTALGSVLFLVLYGGILASLPALRNKKILVWGIVGPYFLFWAIFFSYNLRNFTLSIPPTALAFGLGISSLLKLHDVPTPSYAHFFARQRQKGLPLKIRTRVRQLGCVATCLIVMLAAGSLVHKDMLLAAQDRSSISVLFPKLNQKLLTSYQQGSLPTPLVSGPYHTSKLRVLRDNLAVHPIKGPLASPEKLQTIIQEKNAQSILYRLESTPPATRKYIETLLAGKSWNILWDHKENEDLTFRLIVRCRQSKHKILPLNDNESHNGVDRKHHAENIRQ